MSKGFKFRDNSLKLDIEGHIFEIDVFNVKKGKELIKLGEDINKIANSGSDSQLDEIMELCKIGIDNFLGEGSTDLIFDETNFTFLNIIDLFQYLTVEIENFKKERNFNTYSSDRINESN